MRPTSDDLFDLQSSSSLPSLTTTVSSSGDSELNEQCHSLDARVGSLSRISTISKFAMKLNQIHHVKICAAYDDSVDGATVYVVNVYLRYIQKGLPPACVLLGETDKQRRQRLQLERELERPVYQVEHRYSAFRDLRRRIMKTVSARSENRYHQLCTYCSRVKFIDSSTNFPPRIPNRGVVATCTGWRKLCTHFRKRQLESFVNQLLRAAKDMSYRTGSGQCERFIAVSQILNLFLSAPSMQEMESVW